jgi:Uma2 family endonuclease
MTARVAPMTYRDYAALPDDGKRYEIHDGELWEMAAPTTLHQILLGNLFVLLNAHVTGRRLGLVMLSPLDVILSDLPTETTVLQPDVVYIDNGRLEALHMRGVEGPPTLVVEIFSPSTAVVDRTRKRGLYARYGVPNLWFVDPDTREIEAQVLEAGAYHVVRRVSGPEPVDLPPFVDLGFVPSALWPEFTIRP